MTEWVVQQELLAPSEEEVEAGVDSAIALKIKSGNGGHVCIVVMSRPDGQISFGGDSKDRRPGLLTSTANTLAMSVMMARAFCLSQVAKRLARISTGIRQ